MLSRTRAGRRALAVDPFVFGVSAASVGALLAFSVSAPELAGTIFLGARDWIVSRFGWLLSSAVTFFLGFSIWLAFSRHAHHRLGPPGEPPEFGRAAWLAMLFSAGMGIGLVFFGVAEPVLHFAHPPSGATAPGPAAREAMRLSLFHWGLHAWGIYVVTGLALAHAHHRRGRPLAIRWALEPLLGRHTDRLPGKAVDVLAVLGTLFGLATSLGLGAKQINAGLAELFGVEQSLRMQIGLIAAVTACATLSLVSGLGRGIRRLSELNMLMAGALLLFVLLAGPTLLLIRAIPDTLGGYLGHLVSMSLRTRPFGDPTWQQSWTLFYWAWWISWAPFVGTFIARISRGRTVREFVVGVLLVPTALTLLWFDVFGVGALLAEMHGDGAIASAVDQNVATAIYVFLDQLPASTWTSFGAMAVCAIFFVTSSDSGSFVVDMLTSGGHPDPPIWQRIFWAVTEGAIAAVLLVAGGLRALQSAAVNTGLPFALVLVAVCVALMRALRAEEEAGSVDGAAPPEA